MEALPPNFGSDFYSELETNDCHYEDNKSLAIVSYGQSQPRNQGTLKKKKGFKKALITF